ncbi:CLUMA_CG009220, isoform A [Clunio marinus]|uniref:CLUMA_CG009220, isoform A n=1 Tax=Clunio marinus TaxID=568069 RepID=A0A1J1I6E2_9DIPT|nr:CLUMA_CG009220, isoform A [Clunio marinus]
MSETNIEWKTHVQDERFFFIQPSLPINIWKSFQRTNIRSICAYESSTHYLSIEIVKCCQRRGRFETGGGHVDLRFSEV